MPILTAPARTSWIAVAAAVSAASFVVVPAGHATPFRLAPANCQYEFPGAFVLNQSNGFRVEIVAFGPRVDGGRVTSYNNRQEVAGNGGATGGINGQSVEFTIDWVGGKVGTYKGTIRDDGKVDGGTSDRQGYNASWESVTKLACKEAPAPAAPAPAPAPVPAEKPAEPAPAPEKKPLQGPTVSAKPGLAGVTFTFTDRSGVASQCTYSSEGFSDTFALPANGSTDLFVPAIRQFRTRTGTVSCDNGTSSPTSVEF